MVANPNASLIDGWATRLGLAFTPLQETAKDPDTHHFALLDGVDGSLAVSTREVPPPVGLDWTWSSRLSNHVTVGDEKVLVRPVDKRAPVLRFGLDAVNENLEQFYAAVVGRRATPPVSVVDHVTQCFRAHSALATQNGVAREAILGSFLDIIDELIDPTSPRDIDATLDPEHRERVIDELRYSRLAGRNADLSLTVRHAAGMMFQEAHAELDAEPVPLQLFGLAPAPKRSTRNRLGAYYTPPGLARTLCDLAVAPHIDAETLRILDPACGSGIFLVEVLRSLQRLSYKGKVELIGFDISGTAIEMANFALRHSDCAKGVERNIKAFDFLDFHGNLEADIVLMNPPFVAYQDLSDRMQIAIRKKLGDAFSNKPDFSMLFATLALDQLKPGGTLATLLPAGVLAQTSAAAWRSQIVSGNDIDLLAILGDHGLFRDATVSVSALLLRKTVPSPRLQPTMLWSSQRAGASEDALRRLRQWANGNKQPERTSDWSIYQAREGLVTPKGSWTPRPNSLGSLPGRLAQHPGISTVGSLFQVEQGIRPGRIGDRLIVPVDDWEKLPKREARFFRPVAENGSIRAGQIRPINMMFFPEQPMTRSEVEKAAPTFFHQHLARLDLSPDEKVEAIRSRRGTNNSRMPRLVSRTYVAEDSFAVDQDGSHVVVQGSSWIPKRRLSPSTDDELDMLSDYSLLMNSRLFFLLLREFCRIVGGGQVEASKAATSPVPLPDLVVAYRERPDLRATAERLRIRNALTYPSMQELDAFAAEAYSTSPSEWTLN